MKQINLPMKSVFSVAVKKMKFISGNAPQRGWFQVF
jgi:hypothetical protein